jgi:hypothetical protein
VSSIQRLFDRGGGDQNQNRMEVPCLQARSARRSKDQRRKVLKRFCEYAGLFLITRSTSDRAVLAQIVRKSDSFIEGSLL